jgi:hypothetical protein
MGFGLIIGFMEILQLVATTNYHALTNSCTRLHTTAHIMSSSVTVFTNSCLGTVLNNGDSSAFVYVVASWPPPHNSSSTVDSQLMTSTLILCLNSLYITSAWALQKTLS